MAPCLRGEVLDPPRPAHYAVGVRSELDLRGHPLHSRALAVSIATAADGKWLASGYVLDLRKRGFVPVGSELQGMGIIHHMELDLLIDPATARVERIDARQPTVAFEASKSTCGESCRDPIAGLQQLVGTGVDSSFPTQLRQSFGGIAGCSHLLALAQLSAPTVAWALRCEREQHGDLSGRISSGQRVFRRDLIFDGHELDATRMAVAVQLADLHFTRGPEICLPMDRFAAQTEIRLQVELDGWPAVIAEISGVRRHRTRADFEPAAWEECESLLQPLGGMSLGKGATKRIADQLGSQPPLREAMLMLGPALIQCRAALPDKWIHQVAATPAHPGLIAMLDSCYMWRRDGGLERVRNELAHEVDPDA